MPNAALDYYTDELVRIVERAITYCVAQLPFLEETLLDMLDACFAPRQIVRQIAMIGLLQVLLLSINAASKGISGIFRLMTARGRELNRLLDRLHHHVRTYAEWREVASTIDEMRGHDVWRTIDSSSLFDSHMIKKRIQHTSDMLRRGDVFNLMFRLRGGLARDQFGMQHEGLYTKALSGTKLIIERYHETMCAALNFIADSPILEDEIPTDARLAFFNETRHAYGRTALLLSGGAYFGYYHGGVARALMDEGLLPRVISGASAGSATAAAIGVRTDEELREFLGTRDRVGASQNICTDLFRFRRELHSPIARRLNHIFPSWLQWLSFPVLSLVFEKKLLNMDTEHFKQGIIQNTGLYTFQEAFDRTGRVINITVAPLNDYDPPRLLNYLTAPHVCVWSAAAASCALPGVFDAMHLVVKEPDGQFRPENEWSRQYIADVEDAKRHHDQSHYSDGSVESDLPMQQLSELFNVNHFIVSQVNPHTAIMSSLNLRATVWSNAVYGVLVGYLRFLMSQCRDWLKNIVSLLVFRSKAPLWSTRRGMAQALTQEYEGRALDITIQPWSGHISPLSILSHIIKNPEPSEYSGATNAAELNTWPFLARIRGHCLIEMTLDKCVQRLRKRITDESERRVAAPVSAPRGALDRTPSFYTSRSIVNLSGLSVSDPLPGTGAGGPLKDAGAAQQLFRPSRLQDVWALHRSHDNVAKLARSPSPTPVADFLNLSVPAGMVFVDKDGSPSASAGFPQHGSTDSLKDEIFKTTHMASFYYRNVASEGALGAPDS